MNASAGDVYWDNISGDNLVCRFDGVAPGYEVACFLVTRIYASAYILQAFALWHRAHQQVKLAKTLKHHSIKSTTSNAVTIAVPGISTDNMAQRFRRRFEKLGRLSFDTKVSINGGNTLAALGVSLFLGGPVAYSNQDIRGQLADVLAWYTLDQIGVSMLVADHMTISFVRTTGGFHMCTAWYANLLQHRGAKYFQSLVRFPGDNPVDKPSRSCSLLPSPTAILDECHGRLGALLVLALIVLQFTERISRPVYFDILTALTFVSGMRSFVAIITKRVSTMRRIAVLQNAAGGKAADKQRRQGTLKQKTLQLVIDIVAVFILSCGVPISYLVARSHYSSRRFVMHLAVVLAFLQCTLTVGQVALHRSWRRSMKKKMIQSQVTRGKQGGAASSYTSSNQSGLSIVEQSAVEKQGQGLFSEVG